MIEKHGYGKGEVIQDIEFFQKIHMSQMTREKPLVYLIILNWNNSRETLKCLDSVYRLDYDNFRVLVVDNGSTDNSVSIIRSKYSNIDVLETKENLGYAGGNNAGILVALNRNPKYLLVLNNDVLIAPDTLDHLVAAAERYPNAAFLGPKVYHKENPDHIQSAGANLDYLWRSHQRGLNEPDLGQYNVLEDVDYVIGAAVLVRTNLLKEIGLLDPGFFMYREDVDWCLRAKYLGYRILYVPDAKVWHRCHQVRENDLPCITYYMTRNSLILSTKHHGGAIRFTIILLRHLLTVLTWTVRPKWRHKQIERDALLKGLGDFFRGRVGQTYV